MDRVRIGIIGCGGIARDHASDITGIRVAHAAAPRPKRSAQQRAMRLGVEVYQKFRGRERRAEVPQTPPPPIEGAELVAAADIDPERLRSFASTYRVPKTFADYHALPADDPVPPVFICTPRTCTPQSRPRRRPAGSTSSARSPWPSPRRTARA